MTDLPNDSFPSVREVVANEADMTVVVTGVKLDFGTIFSLVLLVSLSQALIFGVIALVLRVLGVL